MNNTVKRLFTLGLSIVMAAGMILPASAAETSKLTAQEQAIMTAIDKSAPNTKKIAKEIHEFAEPGWKEVKSSKLLMDQLEAQGFKVQRGLVGKHPTLGHKIDMPTAFKAVYKGGNGGPTIAVLAEYDANPNGHSCGHNLISAAAFSCAMGLKQAFQDPKTPGTIIVIGTPAEEMDGAKPAIYEGGYLKEVDLVLASHYSSRWGSEVSGKAIVWPTHDNWLTFEGVASHASSSPHKGKDALDAVMLTALGLEFMREHSVETDRIHYIIGCGGQQANSVPEKARLEFELRANDSGELNHMMKRVDDIIKGAELMTGCKAIYKWDCPWYCATPVPTLYHAAADFANDLGIDGSQFKFDVPPSASSDLGTIAYYKPTVEISFPIVKDGETTPGGHTDGITVLTGTEYAWDQAIYASKLMALTGYRTVTNQKLFNDVKAEFKANYKE